VTESGGLKDQGGELTSRKGEERNEIGWFEIFSVGIRSIHFILEELMMSMVQKKKKGQ